MFNRVRTWIPETIESTIEVPIKLSGHFDIKLIESNSGVIKQHLYFDNLVTDGGLNAIGAGIPLSASYMWLQMGTGTTPPEFSDIDLSSPISVRTANSGGVVDSTLTNSNPEYIRRKIRRVFTSGEANGELTELGFWTAPVGGTLTNHAALSDIAGIPTTVFKTPADILQVDFELRMYLPSDVTGILSFSTSSVTYVIRPQGSLLSNWQRAIVSLGSWNGVAYAYESNTLTDRNTVNNPSTKLIYSSSTMDQYSNIGERSVTFKWAPTTRFTNGIGMIGMSPWSGSDFQLPYQITFTPPIKKTSEQTFNCKFKVKWGRY